MRNALNTFGILVCILTVFACKKNKDVDAELILNDQGLTECPKNSTCNFLYVEHAGLFNGSITLTKGQYRVFWAQITGDYPKSIYFQAPMLGDKFLLDKMDILSGKVFYENNCATCFSIGLKAVDGSVKGIRVPASATAPERWLIEADLYLGTNGIANGAEPTHIKQYFYPAVK